MTNLTGKAKLFEDLMSSQGKKFPTFLLLTFSVGHAVKKGSGDLLEITPKEIRPAEICLTDTVQHHSHINVCSFTKQNTLKQYLPD